MTLNIQLGHTEHKKSNKRFQLCYLLHDMNIPMNVGGLFRVADALGIRKIYLSGTTPVPPNSKIRKTSRATEKFVPYEFYVDPMEIIKRLKEDGYLIISLEITSVSIEVSEFDLEGNEKICLVAGSENRGVNQLLLDNSDKTLHIKMMGDNSSMNVVNACSIATYELTKQLMSSDGF